MRFFHYDCDPGQDDAIALMFALGSGIAQPSSISVVGGNVDVRQCTRNTLQILELTGFPHIPVYTGAAQPLARQSHPLPEVFGESGMDGANLPAPRITSQPQNALSCLTGTALPSLWVATGPLTNLAQAFQAQPSLAQTINHLILMGGCVYPEPIHNHLGNFMAPGTTGWAEYNFAVDPEAAKIVFAAGISRITLIGVEVTRTVLFNHTVEKALRNCGKECATVAANILATVGPEDHHDYASLKAFPQDPVRGMHDVVALAYLTNPEIFTTETLPLRIETGPTPAVPGQSLIDTHQPDHSSVTVVTDLDRTAFATLLTRYLSQLP
jgi:purine nucleosidase